MKKIKLNKQTEIIFKDTLRYITFLDYEGSDCDECENCPSSRLNNSDNLYCYERIEKVLGEDIWERLGFDKYDHGCDEQVTAIKFALDNNSKRDIKI